MRALYLWLLLLAATLACGGDSPRRAAGASAPDLNGAVEEGLRLIELIATDGAWNPSQLVAEPGEDVIIALRNAGATEHALVLEIEGERHELEPAVAPGETGELRLQMPPEPGEYGFHCPLDERRERAVQGLLRVTRPPAVRLEVVASGMVSPIAMVAAPDGDGRRFIVDQVGVIRVLSADDELLQTPFLDLRDRLVELDGHNDERGLLGLALHPDFAQNQRLFVHYSTRLRRGAPDGLDHESHVSEFRLARDDPNRVDRGSERVVMSVDHPQANHTGGMLAFGPDGLLYIALGDGGGAGDQGGGHADLGNAQDASERLGSVLRVEVDPEDTRTHFGVPVDNPFAQGGGAREIFAYGFRSPSGLSFDSAGTHALYVTDMGEQLWEEVNLVELGGNYGWNVLEGTHCFDREDFTRALRGCPMRAAGGALLRWPVVEFARAGRAGGLGLAVIGGHVYRGQALPELQGRYVFGTLARSPSDPRALLLVASDPNADQDDLWPLQRIAIAGDGQYYVNHFLKGIAQDQQGELYLMVSDELGPTGTSGQVLRLEAPGD